MVNWVCTQCGENLEAPDGFSEVIECPKCGHHSRPRTGPPPVPTITPPVEEAPESPGKSKHDKTMRLFFWRIPLRVPTGKVFMGVGVVVLLVAMASDTTVPSGDSYVQNLGLLNDRIVLAIVGAAILVSGAIFAARDSSR
jgi:hypothetical protein